MARASAAAQLPPRGDVALQRAQPTHRDRHHQEEQQIEPLLRRGDGERVERLDEEESYTRNEATDVATANQLP